MNAISVSSQDIYNDSNDTLNNKKNVENITNDSEEENSDNEEDESDNGEDDNDDESEDDNNDNDERDSDNESDNDDDDYEHENPAPDLNVVASNLLNDDSDDEYEDDLQKFDEDLINSYIKEIHPEVISQNFDEISKMVTVSRNAYNIIVDPLHKTLPFLTKYEKTRVIGQRAKQIEHGATPFVSVPPNIIDSHLIAEMELQEKKIPFIIRRPLPNGSFEYWDINDLENINF